MIEFDIATVQVGASIRIPCSTANPTDMGIIEEKSGLGIKVVWWKNTNREQTSFFTYAYLNQQYGTKRKPAPANDLVSKMEQAASTQPKCTAVEELNDDISDVGRDEFGRDKPTTTTPGKGADEEEHPVLRSQLS